MRAPFPAIRPAAAGVLFLLLVSSVALPQALADVDFAILPSLTSVDPGQVFDVELTITQSGSAFNGYDAVVGFDPDALTFIRLSDAEQAGPLMTDACANIFHVFEASPAGDSLTISHILLCSGVDVTGPGVVYRLRFQARDVDETTTISLLAGTAFYNGGFYVTPVFTQAAEVQIGDVSFVPDIQGAPTPNLSAAPNPFNPSTSISFLADETAQARISVYSPRGSLVATLLDEQVFAGPNSVVWDGRNNLGTMMGSGVYLVRLDLGGKSFMQRVTLVK